MAELDVIVVGAGCGGLSAGALLAKEGRRLLVLDQASRVGGCCSTFEHEGFRFDVGASIVEIVEPSRWTFERLGTRLEDEVDMIPCDPIVTAILRDRTVRRVNDRGECRGPSAREARPARCVAAGSAN